MNEFDLIERLQRLLPGNAQVVVGAGDDCAVLDLQIPGRYALFKTDAVVESVHFDPESNPEKIGRKALARNLSDIAAMAGRADCAVVTIGLPEGFDPNRVEAIYRGMSELAARWGVALVGGETTRNPAGTWISVAVLGSVEKGRCILRSGARLGDALFVTGELGGSRAGRHFDFEPRLEEGQWLAEHFEIHSMIDLSDGLAGDLRHLLKSAKLGAELLAGAIPISRAAKRTAKTAEAKTPLAAALMDGEDFELLFTVASRDAVPLLDAWKKKFGKLRLSCIGKIIAGKEIVIRDERGTRVVKEHAYDHFEKR